MKKLILALALFLLPSVAFGQCNGVFANNSICGNISGAPAPPSAFPISSLPSGAQSVNWINVRNAPCNAVGNGIADDTTAINTCIANFNSAGNGVLYFPAGTYLTSSALTPITATGIVRGDGQSNVTVGVTTQPGTLIESSSSTAVLFTNAGQSLTFYDMSLLNTSGSLPTAGAAITLASALQAPILGVNNISIRNFYIGVDWQEAAAGSQINNVHILDPVLYGVRIRNTVNADNGGWEIKGTSIETIVRNPTSGIRWDGSAGGGIMTSVHIIGANAGASFSNGIDLQGVGTTINIGIMNFSIEAINGPAININGSIPNVWIVGGEIADGGGCTINCSGILIANSSVVTIANVIFPNGYPVGAINVSNTANVIVSNINLPGGNFGKLYPGTVPDHDGSGGIGGLVQFQYGTFLNETSLNWHGILGREPELRVLLDPGSTTMSADFHAVNDANNYAKMKAWGSAFATTSLQNKGGIVSNSGLVFATDDTGSTGGTDDISLRAGGTGQETLLVQHNGHINFTGQGITAPTVTAGCNGAGSSVTGTDAAGTVTGQTAVSTTCTLTFGTAYAAAPFCVAVGNTAPLTGAITAATGTLIVNYPSTASFKWTYQCFGK